MPGYKAVRVSGHEKDLQPGLPHRQLLRQNAAVHAGHHHVGKQKVEKAGMMRRDFESCFSIWGPQHAKAVGFEARLRPFPKAAPLFPPKNQFRSLLLLPSLTLVLSNRASLSLQI